MDFYSEEEKKITHYYVIKKKIRHTSNRALVGQESTSANQLQGCEDPRGAIAFQLPSLTLLIIWPAPVSKEGSL